MLPNYICSQYQVQGARTPKHSLFANDFIIGKRKKKPFSD